VATIEADPASSTQLHRRSLGVADIVFFVVAASAPLTVVAGGIPTSYAVTEVVGIPLIYVIIAVILLIFAVGYAAMSRHVANAGAFYTYVSKGLGQMWGVASALVALVAYNAMQVGIYGLFGFAASGALKQFFGIDVAWWVTVLVAMAVIGVLGVLQVDLNAKVLAFFLIAETLVVVVADISGLRHAPEGLTATPFLPSSLTTGALGAALCFVAASFVGFESAALYGEECKNPRRTVARATYTAVIVIGVFYAFSAWATAMTVGNSQVIAKSQEFGPDLLFVFAGQNVGTWFSDVASIFFVTSLFAALLSFHNAVARYFFSLGRERVLPRGLAKVQSRTGAPIAGSLTQTGLALILVLVFVFTDADPVLNLFTWLTNLGALGVILLMALTSVSVAVYLRRHRELTDTGTAHVIAAVVAALSLFTVFVLAIITFGALLGSEPGDPLRWILPGTLFVAVVVGIGYAAVLKGTKPAVYSQIGRGGNLD